MNLESYNPPQSVGELLHRYKAGERHFPETNIDMADATVENDMRGVRLEGADLSHSTVVADLRGANLRYVCFHAAYLKTSDFRGADLTGADFTGAGIDSAEFWGANLDGADFTGAGSYGHTLEPGEMPLMFPETSLTYDTLEAT